MLELPWYRSKFFIGQGRYTVRELNSHLSLCVSHSLHHWMKKEERTRERRRKKEKMMDCSGRLAFMQEKERRLEASRARLTPYIAVSQGKWPHAHLQAPQPTTPQTPTNLPHEHNNHSTAPTNPPQPTLTNPQPITKSTSKILN